MLSKKRKYNPAARRCARRFALQAIYQWQLTQQSMMIVEEQFLKYETIADADLLFFQEILKTVATKHLVFDEQFQPFLNRAFDTLSPIELAILRIGAYELIEHPETPYRVILNEAIELSKEFGGEESYKYVNGILNQLARKIRSQEIEVI